VTTQRSASVAEAISHAELILMFNSSSSSMVHHAELATLLDYIYNLEFDISKMKGTSRLTHPAAVLHEALNRRAD
jgi:hypothetical protein